MNRFIPALLFLANASTAFADEPLRENRAVPPATEQLVAEAITPTMLQIYRRDTTIVPSPGIGPSSRSGQPGDYGYSAWNDLRQLNF